MKLARTTEITCDSCEAIEVVRDGDEIQRYAPSGHAVSVRIVGEKTPATKADLVNAVIARGWAALIPLGDGHKRISGEGAHILIIRSGMRLACPDCSVKDDPAASRVDVAMAAIRASLREMNDILDRHFGD